MANVIIREIQNYARDQRGRHEQFLEGVLPSDIHGTAIVTFAAPGGAPTDSPVLSAFCNLVEIESDADIRVAFRPKGRTTTLPATAQHFQVKAGVPRVFGAYPGCIINVLA